MKKKYSRYEQGKFNPVYKDKYKGTWPIIYRSSWELKAMQYLDMHPSCVEWNSETVVVKYYFPCDKKWHRYFIDLTAKFRNKDGKIQVYYIEIKPYRKTIKPKQTKAKKKSTYMTEVNDFIKNQSKWEAARKFAATKGAKFIIITEKELFR